MIGEALIALTFPHLPVSVYTSPHFSDAMGLATKSEEIEFSS